MTTNNCSGPVSVEVGVVDLQFSMTLSPSSVSAGAEVTVRGTVRNRGSLASSAGRVAFATRDSARNIDVLGFRSFSTIDASASKTFEMAFAAPDAAGDYTVLVCLLAPEVEFACVGEALTVTSTSSGTWSRSGSGNTVLSLPADVRFIHVTGQYTGFSSNFVIWCGVPGNRSGLLVNELLGTGWSSTTSWPKERVVIGKRPSSSISATRLGRRSLQRHKTRFTSSAPAPGAKLGTRIPT